MEKLLELAGKYVPAPFVVALLGMAGAFFGVHYWRGYRDYADTFRDRLFISAIVLGIAGGALYYLNRQSPIPGARKPILIVPFFENDEREQFRKAVAAQLEQAFVRLGLP